MSEPTSPGAHTILVVDDEANIRKVLAATLRRQGWQVLQAKDGAEAILTLQRNAVSTVISDMRMPEVDGMTLLRHVAQHYPDIPVIMLTAFATVDTAVEALKLGAFDYTTKPFETEAIQNTVQKALRQYEANRAEVASEHAPSPAAVTSQFGIIGASQTMQQVFRIIERVANTPSTVLITGESGTGKELIAKAMHYNSGRKNQPFIKINCAAIPEHLVESELFGHEKGAFTGAVSAKPGRFELAHGGTLFLDEIGEVPLEMQVKLLRVLQESEFERVGGVETRRVDVRLVAATNRDLPKEIERGTFREDFYYRLNVVPIVLPPLRDRPADIPALARHFITRNNLRLHRAVEDITDRALSALQAYPWPGNIRELENLVERTMLFLDGDVIDEEDLPQEILQHRPNGASAHAAHSTPAPISPIHLPAPSSATGGLKEVLRETTNMLEKQYIIKALDDTGGNVTQAAKRLQISRKSLQNKMKEFGLREGSA